MIHSAFICLLLRLQLLRTQCRWRSAGLDGAKAAAPRARVAHNHDGRRGRAILTPAPALANVRAASLLAHRGQLQLPDLLYFRGGGIGERGG